MGYNIVEIDANESVNDLELKTDIVFNELHGTWEKTE